MIEGEAMEIADPFFAVALFDRLDDVVFFVKDDAGRYVVVNETLLARCGLAHRAALVGRTPLELFPPGLSAGFAAQDRAVLSSGQPIHDRLELHLYPTRTQGWCLTDKIPLRDRAGRVVGLAGISRDLPVPDQQDPVYSRLAATVAHLQAHYGEPLTVTALAEHAGLSLDQFERHIRRIFGVTPRQLLTKTRLDAAAQQLAGTTESVAAIAYACGYADHSAFSRQFKAIVGVTPSAYRRARESRGAVER